MIREIKKQVSFYLQRRKKWNGDNNFERPVVLSFNFQAKRLCTLIGVRISDNNWDNKRQRVKLGVKRSAEINRYLDRLEEKVNDVYFDALTKGTTITNAYILGHIKTGKEKAAAPGRSLFDYYIEYLTTQRTVIQPGTYKSCMTSMNRFSDFCTFNKTPDIKFDDVNPKLLSQYNEFLLKAGNTNNTIHSHLKRLRRFMLYAKKVGLHSNDSYREYNVPERVGVIKFLDLDEVKKLMEVEVHSSMERKAKDLMLFGCFTAMRYGDMKNLKLADIKEHRFENVEQVFYAAHITQIKTSNKLIIPLLPEALAILKKYEGTNGEFALPTLAGTNMNAEIKNVARKAGLTALQKVERYLGTKRETKYIEKWRLISTHFGRRTFVTIAATRGIPINIVASCTGQNPATTMKHYMGVIGAEKFKELAAKMKF